jgi:hypothetical protein
VKNDTVTTPYVTIPTYLPLNGKTLQRKPSKSPQNTGSSYTLNPTTLVSQGPLRSQHHTSPRTHPHRGVQRIANGKLPVLARKRERPQLDDSCVLALSTKFPLSSWRCEFGLICPFLLYVSGIARPGANFGAEHSIVRQPCWRHPNA